MHTCSSQIISFDLWVPSLWNFHPARPVTTCNTVSHWIFSCKRWGNTISVLPWLYNHVSLFLVEGLHSVFPSNVQHDNKLTSICPSRPVLKVSLGTQHGPYTILLMRHIATYWSGRHPSRQSSQVSSNFNSLEGNARKHIFVQQAGTWNFSTWIRQNSKAKQAHQVHQTPFKHVVLYPSGSDKQFQHDVGIVVPIVSFAKSRWRLVMAPWVKGWMRVLKTSLWMKSSKSTNMIFFIYTTKNARQHAITKKIKGNCYSASTHYILVTTVV